VKLFAGIDGGQTATTALIGDERGNVLGRGAAGPADEVGQDARSTRLRDALHGALSAALADASLPADARFEKIVAGISGYDGRVRGVAPALDARCIDLMHDAPIAHAGALDGRPGIVVIAGTGSVVYGRADGGASVTVGGWGYLFGDEGSAFWIARCLIEAAMSADDRAAGGSEGSLEAGLLEFFAMPSLRALAGAFYGGELTRDRIAAFSERALELSNPQVDEVVSEGTGALAGLAGLAARRLSMTRAEVAVIGGLMRSPRYAGAMRAALKTQPVVRVVDAARQPVEGALLMAIR